MNALSILRLICACPGIWIIGHKEVTHTSLQFKFRCHCHKSEQTCSCTASSARYRVITHSSTFSSMFSKQLAYTEATVLVKPTYYHRGSKQTSTKLTIRKSQKSRFQRKPLLDTEHTFNCELMPQLHIVPIFILHPLSNTHHIQAGGKLRQQAVLMNSKEVALQLT